MKVVPNRTFLLRQEHKDGKLEKTVIARKGEKIEVTSEEAVKFAGYWVADEDTKKKVNEAGKSNQGKRIV